MKITITLASNGLSHDVDISDQLDIQSVKATIEALTDIPSIEQWLVFNGLDLNNATKTLQQYNVQEGSIILVKKQKAVFSAVDIARAMQNVSSSSISPSSQLSTMTTLQLASAFLTMADNPNFSLTKDEVRMAIAQHNPSHPTLLRLVEEFKRAEVIEDNFRHTMEYHPEAFVSVSMLFIDVEINKVPLHVLVDSGAQMTLMGMACAEKCQLSHLIDKRFSGRAEGVGSAAVLGRIHLTDIKINQSFMPCTFSVLEKIGPDCIFGLDMLKRHQCSIDLKKWVLRVGQVETPFISDIELEKRTKAAAITAIPSHEEKGADNNNNGAHIESLMALGVSREQALDALQRHKGDVDLAAGSLFN